MQEAPGEVIVAAPYIGAGYTETLALWVGACDRGNGFWPGPTAHRRMIPLVSRSRSPTPRYGDFNASDLARGCWNTQVSVRTNPRQENIKMAPQRDALSQTPPAKRVA